MVNYLRTHKIDNAELMMKAEQYMNIGYQRLLGFEVDGGGFDWYGNPPANIILSAYGLLEFNDMAKVFDIDERVIDRTQAWLLNKQKEDGRWTLDAGGRTAWSWSGLSGDLIVTAYVAWSIGESLEGEPAGSNPVLEKALDKALSWIRLHWDSTKDPYSLSLIANAFAAHKPDGDYTLQVCNALEDLATTTDGKVSWSTSGQSVTYSTGISASIETTAMAAYAMLKTGRYTNVVNGALDFLVAAKNGNGTWGSTQATITAMKTLLRAAAGSKLEGEAFIDIYHDDELRGTWHVTEENSDVMQMLDLGAFTHTGENKIKLVTRGSETGLIYQVVGRHYMPWKLVGEQRQKPIEIKVDYDRTYLRTDDVINATASMTYNGAQSTFMVVLELGIPPGFKVNVGDFAEYLGGGKIDKFELTPRHVILYLGQVDPGSVHTFRYTLTAKYPVKALTPHSSTYEYYSPDVRDTQDPVELEVGEKE